jgi:hypothetical protein
MKLLKWRRPATFTHSTDTHNYPRKLNIGCGFDKRLDHMNVDIDPNCNPDLLLDPNGNMDALPRNYFSEVLARDVLEHFPRNQSLRNLLEWNELLVATGILKLVTTDILSVAQKLKENKTYADHHGWTICLFGNQVQFGDYHLTGFTEITLQVLLSAAGFEVVTKGYIDEWCFDWAAKKVDSWSQFVEDQESYTDVEFLEHAYRKVFLRELDNEGKSYFHSLLKEGHSRRKVYLELASSPEALFVKARALSL